MVEVANQQELRELQAGDRVKYRGLQWDVKDYSTYAAPEGYETFEWLLRSPQGQEYYLLREIDPKNPQTLVNWYLAEEIAEPKLYLPEYPNTKLTTLWQDMRDGTTPYPVLQMFSKSYYFESAVEGNYDGDEEDTTRLNWDYWDRERQWNLALEAWPNGELHVYHSKVVKPQEFSEIVKAVKVPNRANLGKTVALIFNLIGALAFLGFGIYLLIFG